ncbi:MAG: flagellar hook-associated protein FlgK [Alphaproteobacteria bacterium]|nr:flagellar hook-associated protein FlgK [Alphaproteobacteria bacterium]
MPLSSISSILIAANSGMRASQIGLDVVSRNIANASTDGYTRKTIHLQNQIVGSQGQGVIAGEIQRTVNQSLQKEIRRGNSLGEAMRVREDFLGRLELAFGSPGDESSIAAQLTDLGNAFRALAAQPDSSTQQQAVLAEARAFATSANTLSNTIQSLRLDAEQTIDAAVTTIGMNLQQIDNLNQQIVQARGLQQSTADLEDKRDVLLNNLAKDIDVTFFERPNGDVWILTQSGRQLLDGTPSELTFNNKSSINATMTYAGGALGGIELGGVDITSEIRGGRLRGLIDMRDDYLVDAQTQLDELTARVAQTFALSDLDLFSYGDTETVLTGREAAAAATSGATSFTIDDATDVAVGMQLRFANHATTYTITAVAGTTITIEPPSGATTGLDVDVPAGTALILAAAPSALSIGFSTSVAVNSDVESDPWRLRDGTTAAAPSAIAQDNTIPRAIVDAFERIQPFSVGPGLGESLTLTGYAGALITSQANRRASAKDSLESQLALNEQISNRFNSDSGVNVDRELALMIEIQNAYAASAKVIQATRDMFDELLRVAA